MRRGGESVAVLAPYQQAQCDYVRALQPDANVRPTSAAPSAAEVVKIACRVDLAHERIEPLK